MLTNTANSEEVMREVNRVRQNVETKRVRKSARSDRVYNEKIWKIKRVREKKAEGSERVKKTHRIRKSVENKQGQTVCRK